MHRIPLLTSQETNKKKFSAITRRPGFTPRRLRGRAEGAGREIGRATRGTSPRLKSKVVWKLYCDLEVDHARRFTFRSGIWKYNDSGRRAVNGMVCTGCLEEDSPHEVAAIFEKKVFQEILPYFWLHLNFYDFFFFRNWKLTNKYLHSIYT